MGNHKTDPKMYHCDTYVWCTLRSLKIFNDTQNSTSKTKPNTPKTCGGNSSHSTPVECPASTSYTPHRTPAFQMMTVAGSNVRYGSRTLQRRVSSHKTVPIPTIDDHP